MKIFVPENLIFFGWKDNKDVKRWLLTMETYLSKSPSVQKWINMDDHVELPDIRHLEFPINQKIFDSVPIFRIFNPAKNAIGNFTIEKALAIR